MNARLDTGEGAVPTFLTPKPENIPPELRALPWACWDPKPRPAGGYAKAPIHPVTGHNLRTNHPEEWFDFEGRALKVNEAQAKQGAGGGSRGGPRRY